MYFAPIVEGHGEVYAVPALLHRIAQGSGYSGVLRVNPPARVKVGSFRKDDEYFAKHVTLAAAKAAQEGGCVLILLDCEDECPAILGPHLLRRVYSVRPDVSTLVVLARREYETWFLSAARSLRGRFGLPADLEPPIEPEHIRDAKGWLGSRMNTPYDPVIHQIELTRVFDLDAACASPSFDRLRRRVRKFLAN